MSATTPLARIDLSTIGSDGCVSGRVEMDGMQPVVVLTPLIIPPVDHVEARKVERALGCRAAGAALTAPGCGVGGDRAWDDLILKHGASFNFSAF